MITKDSYEMWLDNEVTKAFFDAIKEDLESLKGSRIFGSTENMIMMAHERNANMDMLEQILDWKPENLIEDKQ